MFLQAAADLGLFCAFFAIAALTWLIIRDKEIGGWQSLADKALSVRLCLAVLLVCLLLCAASFLLHAIAIAYPIYVLESVVKAAAAAALLIVAVGMFPVRRWLKRCAAEQRTMQAEVAEQTRQLAASKARFETLVFASAEVFWTADASGQVVEASPSWSFFCGQSPEEQLGEGWLDAVHPDDRERTRALWRKAVRTGGMFETEYRMWHVSGEWRWMASRAAPPLTDLGTVREWVGMNEDITERKKAAEAIRLQADQYETFLAATSDGYWLMDWDGSVRDVNEAYCRMSGYTREEMLSLNITDLDYSVRENAVEYVEEIKRQGFVHFETTHRRKDGGVISAEVSAVYWQPTNQLVLFIRDITDRKRSEMALRESEEKLKEAQQIGDLGSWELDLVSRKFTWSEEMYRLFGRDPNSPLPSFDESLSHIHPDDRERVALSIDALIATGEPSELEYRVSRADGQELIVEARTRRYDDEDGKPVRVAGVVHDITQLKLAQDELREHKKNLEEQVKQRTRALARINDKLKEANREMEAFSYSVSHDLRVPLRAVDGFSRILLEDYGDKFDEDGVRVITIIRENTIRMGMLIDDILSFSRVSRAEMVMSEIDMGAQVRSVLQALEPGLQDRKLTFDVGPLPTVMGDANTLQRVWSNLIENAVKYSSKKPEARIEIGAMSGKDETTFYVKDNGVGFDMAQADRLFGVFQRLHGSEFGGTGIGLAIAKRIVDRHGGKIWAEGKVGEGATFYFTLPVRAASPAGGSEEAAV
jgi:PAS domain S-box-containing protein